MEIGSTVCFKDPARTGVFVVNDIREEEYLEKIKTHKAVERKKQVYYLYDLMDKRRVLWTAFEDDICLDRMGRLRRARGPERKRTKIKARECPLNILCRVALGQLKLPIKK